MEITNKLICGDNLEELKKIEKESVSLIYIDPPFFTHRQYEVIWGDEAETRSFEDRWEGGIEHYISWIKPRIEAMYETLKPTGSFYLHCDWHANAYLRILCDKIFGEKNFRNEVIWWYETGGIAKRDFSRKHDTIFRYSKSNKYIFNDKEIKEKRSDEVLRRIATGYANATRSTGQFRHPSDVWKIPAINAMAKERLGYPTQKPEALLERIIKASSNKGDIVLDAFCGCGTALVVAQKLGRNWIGIDISPTAIKLVEKRLMPLGIEKDNNYIITGTPITIQDLRKLKPFEFQNWVINRLQAKHSKKKTGDMGIDGYLVRDDMFAYHNAGIQVKQSENIGRNVIDNFKSAIERAGHKEGIIVAFSFGKGAIEEVARLKNANEININLITIEELLYGKK